MSYGTLVTVRGVLPDEDSRRLLSGGSGQSMSFDTLEQAEAAAARLASVPGAERQGGAAGSGAIMTWWGEHTDALIGLGGVAVGFGLSEGVRWLREGREKRSRLLALHAELAECRDMLTTFLRDQIAAPLYRLPTFAAGPPRCQKHRFGQCCGITRR